MTSSSSSGPSKGALLLLRLFDEAAGVGARIVPNPNLQQPTAASAKEDTRERVVVFLANAIAPTDALWEVPRVPGPQAATFSGSISDVRDAVARVAARAEQVEFAALHQALSPFIQASGTSVPEPNRIGSSFPLRSLTHSGNDAVDVASLCGLVERMLTNVVRKCGGCGKPNAYTLSVCNQCGSDISTTPITKTNNVFMGFVLGIALAPPFPLQISLRCASKDTLVIDDLLGLSPLHVNAIPTAEYIPDWRYLLRRPVEGLAVVQRLKESVCGVAREQFLSKPAWCHAFIKGGVKGEAAALSPENDLLMGFNFPPSQAQLHLQCIAPIMLPFQYAQYLRDVHYTPQRFFPVEYVADLLTRIADDSNMIQFTPASIKGSTPAVQSAKARLDALDSLLEKRSSLDDPLPMIEGIVAFATDVYSLSYDAYRAALLRRVEEGQCRFANWRGCGGDDANGTLCPLFKGAIVSSLPQDAALGIPDLYIPFLEGEERKGECADDGAAPIGSSAAAKALIDTDKLALQAYGRPYDNGRPSGSFNPQPRHIDDIDVW